MDTQNDSAVDGVAVRPLPDGRGSVGTRVLGRVGGWWIASCLVLAVGAPEACGAGDARVSRQHGVTIIRGHLRETIVTADAGVEVLAPIHSSAHGRSQAWVEWVDTYRRARAGATVTPRPRIRRPAPPWKYTPSDQTYTPKTDWTYHPKRFQRWL